jgi:two-component system, NtrC family, sensor kinase
MTEKKKTSIIREVISSLVVLMVAATVLISITVIWTSQLQGIGEKFTPMILVLYIVLFALVVAVFGTMFLRNYLVLPLRKILDATEKISQGKFEVSVEVDANNELGQLASAFNRMAEELAQRQRNLESQLNQLEQINAVLTKTQDQLIISEKLASVGKLAAGVAHEIGNPLSIVNGYLEMIMKSARLESREKDMLTRMDGELKRINQIIRELIDYARPPVGELQLVDVNLVITETLKLMETQKEFHKIQTELRLADNLPMIKARPNQLKQVFVNLFLNALDAMDGGGVLGLRTYAGLEGAQEVVAEVSDNGVGIPAENLHKIFDPFFSTKEPGKGVGLGLSISLKLIEVMNGKMEVESEPGKGSTFKLRFKYGGQESVQQA